jgi:tetratricopeptide (TPR) repeat protein
MSLKSSLLVATAMVSYFGLAMAQTAAPLVIAPAGAPAAREPQPAPAFAPARAQPATPPRAEQGFKPVRPQQGEARGQAAAPAQKLVDESALNYYASLGQTARVAAEIRRLKTLHPAWQPPANLFAAGSPQVDEKPLWELYAANRFDDLREQIDALKAEYPDYAPSLDLTTKVNIAERRQALVAASQQRDWEHVVALATDSQDLLVCREIDVLWRLAEAFASLEDKDQTLSVYRYILANCENSGERLATVQKAALVLPEDDVAKLIAAGKRGRSGGNEFDGVKLDLVRRDIGAIASGQSAPAPSERDLKLIEASARTAKGAADAGLLGWYAFQAKDYAKARDWFKLGYGASKDAKLLEGHILALRNLGEIGQARTLAFQNLSVGPLIRKAYIEIAASELPKPDAPSLPADEMRRVEEIVEGEKSGLGAQALGWHLFHARKFGDARAWFEKATRWNESEESVLGLALAMQRLGDRKAYASFIAENKGRYQTLAKLAEVAGSERAIVSGRRGGQRGGGGAPSGVVRQAVKLYESGNYKEAADLMDRNQQRLDPNMSALRGWAHFQANNYQEAEKIFKKHRNVKGAEHGEFLSYIAGKSIAHRWYQ